MKFTEFLTEAVDSKLYRDELTEQMTKLCEAYAASIKESISKVSGTDDIKWIRRDTSRRYSPWELDFRTYGFLQGTYQGISFHLSFPQSGMNLFGEMVEGPRKISLGIVKSSADFEKNAKKAIKELTKDNRYTVYKNAKSNGVVYPNLSSIKKDFKIYALAWRNSPDENDFDPYYYDSKGEDPKKKLRILDLFPGSK